MKLHRKALIVALVCISLVGVHSHLMACQRDKADKEYSFWNALSLRATAEAQARIGHPNAQDGLVLTNAGYAVVNNHTTEPCLDGVRQWNGASPGKATVLEVHSARNSALWFLFYNMNSGDSVYCELNATSIVSILEWLDYLSPKQIRRFIATIPAGDLFVRLAQENIKAENLLASQASKDAWTAKVQAKVFGGREFAIVTIANSVPHGTPYDLIKSFLFHDHYCPGVTSGYLLANYLEKNFPVLSADDKYFVLSIPPWCKDDALQVLLNTTPGKSGYAVFYLNADDKTHLKPEAKEIAGIFFRWNGTQYEGRVLSFSFATATAMSGINTSVGPGWDSRLAMDLWFLDYLDQPELFIQTIKEFTLPAGKAPSDWARPGVNPVQDPLIDLWQ
jgi:formylmethanofuran dehydrogenase subunit E-like metal-binding protein